jgi:hypothetical protein
MERGEVSVGFEFYTFIMKFSSITLSEHKLILGRPRTTFISRLGSILRIIRNFNNMPIIFYFFLKRCQ